LNFLDSFSENAYQDFTEVRLVEEELFHAERQTRPS